MKGHYPCPSVRTAHDRRIAGLKHPDWVEAMALLINVTCVYHFRWFDVGDVQDDDHMMKIISVCMLTPEIAHWMPTQERQIVRKFQKHIPENLTVRVSSTFIDVPQPFEGFPTSFVSKNLDEYVRSMRCQAKNGQCGACRNCWNKSHDVIGYRIK